LILVSRIRTLAAEAKQYKEMRFMTVRQIMEALECIIRITYSGRYGCTISELAPLQREIMSAFALQANS
jgi:hypothetical protein